MAEQTLLQMKDVTMEFPGVKALDNVSLTLNRGEVLVLMGENGAGKSTLMKILSGAYHQTKGTIYLDGEEVRIKNPHDAQMLGISIIYQELNLIPYLTVAENIWLGRQPEKRKGRIDWKKMNQDTQALLDEIGVDFAPTDTVGDLKVANQQMVELAKALSFESKIIIMDEPTSSLTEKEIEQLFRIIRELRDAGKGIVYISHRLDEIHQIGDRVMILRDGQYITEEKLKEISLDQVVEHMVGRSINDQFPKEEVAIGEEIFRVEGISTDQLLKDCSFSLHAGEILGFSGLVGSGRTELMRAITAADKKSGGAVYIDGKQVEIKHFSDAVNAGIAFLTEDRKMQGLVLGMDVKSNITLCSLDSIKKGGRLNLSLEKEEAQKLVDRLRVKTPSLAQTTRNLSGGNQQKVVLAKWLFSKSKVFIFDEPTRGIDVGAKVEIYKLMTELVRQGAGIIMISSEMPEVIGMSDRVCVMSEGRITGTLEREELSQVAIMQYASGMAQNTEG